MPVSPFARDPNHINGLEVLSCGACAAVALPQARILAEPGYCGDVGHLVPLSRCLGRSVCMCVYACVCVCLYA